MRNLFKKPSPEELRADLLAEHQRRLIQAQLNYEHAKAAMEMEQSIITRLLDNIVTVGAGIAHVVIGSVGGGAGGGAETK